MGVNIQVSGQEADDPENPPPPELPQAVRSVDFSATITAVVESEEEGAEPLETITGVSAELIGDPDSGLIITSGETSVVISGKHNSGFVDIFQYVSKGSNTTVEIPTVVIGQENVPPDQDLFDLNQDKNQFITKNFLVTVSYTVSSSKVHTAEFTVPQVVANNLDAMKDFMGSYFK